MEQLLRKRQGGKGKPTAVEGSTYPPSPNGKADRRKLAACEADSTCSAGSFVPPRTPSEETLATIWMQVFNLPRVGVNDNFFELGGHSLLAFQIVTRIWEAFQVDLPLQVMFQYPTLASLAGVISDLRDKRERYDATGNSLTTAAPQASHVPPRDAAEAAVLEIWQEHFGRAPLCVEQNFFAAGGDALLALKLLGSLRRQLKLPFELRDVFLCQTVAAQAARAQALELQQNMEMTVC